MYESNWAAADVALTEALALATDDERTAARAFRRGQGRFMADRFAEARADFDVALAKRAGQPRVDVALWRWLATKRLGEPVDRAAMASAREPAPEAKWMTSVLDYYLVESGPRVDVNEVYASCADSPTDLCMAAFYFGANAAALDQPDLARAYWRTARETGRDWLLEYCFASAWLRRLPPEPEVDGG